METVNPLLTSALEFLRDGNVEAAESGFGEAASACCEAYGEARHCLCAPFFGSYLDPTTNSLLSHAPTPTHVLCPTYILACFQRKITQTSVDECR